MLKLKTNRLFYGKYPYKVVLTGKGFNFFSLYGAIRLVKMVEKGHFPSNYNTDKVSLKKVAEFIIAGDKQIRVRAEGNRASLFLSNKELFEDCIEKFKILTSEIHEPEDEETLKFLLENNKKIITNKLPHDKYRYKVHLRMMSSDEGENLIKWANNNKRVRLNQNPLYSLKYGYNAYLLVEDQPTITMLTLLASNKIIRIEEYVVRN